MTRDALEALFDRPAAIALGRPSVRDPLLARPDVAGTLLVLREAMHHLGFEQLQFSR